jgi:hypothetical protein
MIRSALAVVLGITALTAALFAIDEVANPWMIRTFPEVLSNLDAIHHNIWAILFSFAYQVVCVAGGGDDTARVAGRLGVRHAVIIGVIQTALVIPAMMAFPSQAPMTIWLKGTALILPSAWFGGLLRERTRATASTHEFLLHRDAARLGVCR